MHTGGAGRAFGRVGGSILTYLLDTNICIAFLNGKDENLRDYLLSLEPPQLRLCSVVKAELLYGARKSEKVNDNLARLEQFFPLFQSHAFDDRAAVCYGQLRATLEREGTPIGANDMLIASIALTSDFTLMTRNIREFARIPGLRTLQV